MSEPIASVVKATQDMRDMVAEITSFVAQYDLDWEKPGIPGHLLVRAASLLEGMAVVIDKLEPDIRLVRDVRALNGDRFPTKDTP